MSEKRGTQEKTTLISELKCKHILKTLLSQNKSLPPFLRIFTHYEQGLLGYMLQRSAGKQTGLEKQTWLELLRLSAEETVEVSAEKHKLMTRLCTFSTVSEAQVRRG